VNARIWIRKEGKGKPKVLPISRIFGFWVKVSIDGKMHILTKYSTDGKICKKCRELHKCKNRQKLESKKRLLIKLGGDCELDVIIKALEFIASVLKSVVEEGSYPGGLGVCKRQEEGE
jgi:hypothetical protein